MIDRIRRGELKLPICGLAMLIAGAAGAQDSVLTGELRTDTEAQYAFATDCIGLSQMFDNLEQLAPGFVDQGIGFPNAERAQLAELYWDIAYLTSVGLGVSQDQLATDVTDAANVHITGLNEANALTGLTPASPFFVDSVNPHWRECTAQRPAYQEWLTTMKAVLDAN